MNTDRKAFTLDPYQSPETGESVLVAYGPFFRVEPYAGQECLGRWVETDLLDDDGEPDDWPEEI